MFIGKLLRAARNQLDWELGKFILFGVGAWCILLAALIVGIITQPDKGPPIMMLGALLLYAFAVSYWAIRSLLVTQKNDDYRADLSARKAAFLARLDLDPTLSTEEKVARVKSHFLLEEPIYS